MAIAVNDIIQITDFQTLLGQQIANVYFYRITAVEALADLGDLSTAFVTGVMEEVESLQSTVLTHTLLSIRNLTNGIDIADIPLTGHIGEATGGDTLPTYCAFSFRLVRTNGTTRHGAKRIAGALENMIAGNDVTAPVLATLNGLAHVFSDDLVVTGTVDHDLTAEPIIVGRVPQGNANAGALDLTKINPVASAQYVRFSTQVTRRAGRGA